MDLFKKLFGNKGSDSTPTQPPASVDSSKDDALWQQVYDARNAEISKYIGPAPADITKMIDMTGVWPGGGLLIVPAERLGPGLTAYMSFGLTNPDMPTQVSIAGRNGNTIQLKRRPTPRPSTGRPGYGYELVIVAREQAQWPLYLLQWAVKAEMLNDADILRLVEANNGLTVEEIGIGPSQSVHILISKAQSPLPASLELPTGSVDVLAITVITEDEMRWGMENGRAALLDKLMKSDIGQTSVLDRKSVVSLIEPGGDYSHVTSVEIANDLMLQEKLFRILLFPVDFGGEDTEQNIIYVPRGVPVVKDQITNWLIELAEDGTADDVEYYVEPKGDSVVPSRIRVKATNSGTGASKERVIEIW